MKKLLEIGNQYIKESDWKVIAVLKFCLISLGILIGMNIPHKGKRLAAIGCTGVFVLTYVPLMAKLLKMLFGKGQSCAD